MVALLVSLTSYTATNPGLAAEPPDDHSSASPPKDLAPSFGTQLVRELYEEQAWIDRVKSFRMRRTSVQRRAPASPENVRPGREQWLNLLDDPPSSEPVYSSTDELAWDKTHLRSVCDSTAQWGDRLTVITWDGQLKTHFAKYRRSKEDDWQEDVALFSEPFERIKWEYEMLTGLALDDCRPVWWNHFHFRKEDASFEEFLASRSESPDDFVLIGREAYGGRDCFVVESPASGKRFYIDAAKRRLRGQVKFFISNLDADTRLSMMREIGGEAIKTTNHWRSWLKGLSPRERREALRRYGEALRPYRMPSVERCIDQYRQVAAGKWIPMRCVHLGVFPVGDRKDQRYELYRQDRIVTEIAVNESLDEAMFVTKLPKGLPVSDERFDPPLQYEYDPIRTEAELQELVEQARADQHKRGERIDAIFAKAAKRLGQQAPEFPETRWFNGEPHSLKGLRGSVVILHFWATWCGPCHKDLQRLANVAPARTSGITLIGVHAAGAQTEDVQEEIDEYGLEYPILLETKGAGGEDATLQEWYGVRGIPYAVAIDKHGKVAAHGRLSKVFSKARELVAAD